MSIRVVTNMRLDLKMDGVELSKAIELVIENQPEGWPFYIYVDRSGVEFNSFKFDAKFKKTLDQVPPYSTIVIVVEYGKMEMLYDLLKELQKDQVLLKIDGESLILETPSLYKKDVNVFIKEHS